MTRTPILLALGLSLAALAGCVEDGPGYVESRVVNEGQVGVPVYRSAPIVQRTVVIDNGPRYSGRAVYRDPAYRGPRASSRPGPYDRGRYVDRGRYDRDVDDRFDRRRYCDGVGYDDPRCD